MIFYVDILNKSVSGKLLTFSTRFLRNNLLKTRLLLVRAVVYSNEILLLE